MAGHLLEPQLCGAQRTGKVLEHVLGLQSEAGFLADPLNGRRDFGILSLESPGRLPLGVLERIDENFLGLALFVARFEQGKSLFGDGPVIERHGRDRRRTLHVVRGVGVDAEYGQVEGNVQAAGGGGRQNLFGDDAVRRQDPAGLGQGLEPGNEVFVQKRDVLDLPRVGYHFKIAFPQE